MTHIIRFVCRTVCLFAGILLFAGNVHSQPLEWRNVTPQTGPQPEARRYGTAIYDPVARRIVVFGGLGSSGFLNDVWALDVATKTWTRLEPSGPSPARRFGHNAVYDNIGHQMVVWAGQQGSQFYNDIWTLDLQSLTWRDVSPSRRPKARYGSASVFDPTARSLVQFAGFTEESIRYQDTQAFNLQTSSWTDLTPSGTLPQVRCLLTGAFDRMGRRMVIFGGQRSGPLGDFWSFDLQSRSWTALNTSQGPSARFFSTSFIDVDGSFVLFGGTTATGDVNDTWVHRFDSGGWTQLQTTAAPSPRSGMMGAYIEAERRFIIFGGSGNGLLNDVWELSPATTPSEQPPTVPTKTAVVMVNPGSQPAEVSFFFTDSEGQDLAPGVATIPANGQLARFVHEAPFNGPAIFRGTFTIRSNVPISVAALRSFANAQSGFIAASLPVVDLSASSQDSAVLPLVTDGGGWSSEIVLVNPTDQVLTGSIRFPTEGETSGITGRGLPYFIPARSARTVQRVGAGNNAQAGWASVTPAQPQPVPAAFVILSLNPGSLSGTNTAFNAGTPATAFRVYVEGM